MIDKIEFKIINETKNFYDIDVILNDGKIENYLIVDLGQENIEEKKLKNFFKLGE